MVDQHGVVVIRGTGGIEQGGQQISLGVPDAGVVLADAVQNLLDMAGGDLLKPLLHKGGGVLRVPSDLDGRAAGHSHLQHQLHKLVHLGPVDRSANQVILDLFPNFLSLLIHVLHSFQLRCGKNE